MKKNIVCLTFIFLLFTILTGCKKNEIQEGTRKLVGMTFIESTSEIEFPEKTNSINDITINGFYLSSDYSVITFSGNTFNNNFELSRLEGDIITPDSICLYASFDYYQAYSSTTPIKLYRIYQDKEGYYEVVADDTITNMNGTHVYNITNEEVMDSLNYVVTCVIRVSKVGTPVGNKIIEFDANNQIINSHEVVTNDYNFNVNSNTSYIIIEEKSLDESNQEITNRTLLEDFENQYHVFKLLVDNKIYGKQIKFVTPK